MSARITAEEFYGECIDKPLDMVMLRRIFLLLTRIHWSDGRNHYQEDVDFSCLTYSDTDSESKLSVELTDVYDDNDTDNFPGVFIGFQNGFKMSKQVLDYNAGSSEDNSVMYKTVTWDGILSIKHVHSSADTALAMADSTFVFLTAVRESMFRRFSIQKMDFENVSPPARLEADKSNRFFSVDLTLSLQFTVTVNVNIEGHRLKTWGVELSPSNNPHLTQ